MKDKLSKVKNLVKKYGLTGTIKKMTGYIYSNYIVRISMKEKIYVALNKKEIRKRLSGCWREKTTTALWYGEVLLDGMCLCIRDRSIFLLTLQSREPCAV